METFVFLLKYLEQHQALVPGFGPLLKFIEAFCATFEAMDCLGLKQTRAQLELSHKRASENHPNDLVALLPNRNAVSRVRRHAPMPVEFIFSATSESEARNVWTCHLLPRLPPAFQELYLRRLRDPASVPDPLWIAFVRLVLLPLGRVLEGRRVSSLVGTQFHEHLWKRDADWTYLRKDWLVATKTTAFEGPYDALNMYVLCLFQEELKTVQSLLSFRFPHSLHVIYAFVDLPSASRRDAKFLARFLEFAKAPSFLRALQHPLFHTGSAAREGVLASSSVATPGERARVVELGAVHGCHHCTHRHPQPKWAASMNYWILDHQPPRSRKFRALMEAGEFTIGPILTNDFVYNIGALGDATEAYEDFAAYLSTEAFQFTARDGKSYALLAYAKATKKALLGYLNRLYAYTQAHEDTQYRFYLHCHDCAGIQGGLVQSLVKLAAEIKSLRVRMFKKTATVKEQAFFLERLCRLHDLLEQAFDPRRPLFRLEETRDCVSIPATRATGTKEQREALVGQSQKAQEGQGARSALGLENPLILQVSGAACHSCKATVPAPRTLWTADHVAPSVLVELGLRQGPQVLYPQCIYCRKAQSVLAAGFARVWNSATTAEEWDALWMKALGAPLGDGYIDPSLQEDDDDLLDDVADLSASSSSSLVLAPAPPPMTGGGPETANVSRLACLAQEVNTCGQRAAYNAAAMLTHAGNAGALQAALANDVALRAIGPMGINVADNDVRNLLDANGGANVALISDVRQARNICDDVRNCTGPADLVLYGFIHGRMPTACVVMNTLAAGLALPSLASPATGSAKVGHYIAVYLSRDATGGMVATYADSLAHAAPRAALIDSLRVAIRSM